MSISPLCLCLAVLLSVTVGTLLSPSTSAQTITPPIVPQQGLLVLRNGQILEGAISQAGEHYVVALPGSGEVRLPRERVEFYCLDLDDAYRRKRSVARPGQIADHLDLAQWCLHHGLLDQAAEQLQAAAELDASHPRLGILQRRTTFSRQAATPTPGVRPAPLQLPQVTDAVEQLPAEAMEHFMHRVQPLLLNRCGSSPCHGTTSPSQFRLLRPSWGDPITRRITHRNLQAVLKTVDIEDPASSMLLQQPLIPHGGTPAVFDEQSAQSMEQFELLLTWVSLLTRQQQPAQPATIGEPDQVLLQSSGSAETGSSAAPGLPQKLDADATTNSPGQQSPPEDPFDPEQFNRQFFDQ